jgi:hypothetical protein
MSETLKSFEEITGARTIVTIQLWNDMLILATQHNLYAVLKDGSVELMKFKYQDLKE